jgi:hypothetical protein
MKPREKKPSDAKLNSGWYLAILTIFGHCGKISSAVLFLIFLLKYSYSNHLDTLLEGKGGEEF